MIILIRIEDKNGEMLLAPVSREVDFLPRAGEHIKQDALSLFAPEFLRVHHVEWVRKDMHSMSSLVVLRPYTPTEISDDDIQLGG